MSVVDPIRDGKGWAFRERDGHGADPICGFQFLSEPYLRSDPTFTGRVTVPCIWDRVTQRIVTNNYPDITYGMPAMRTAAPPVRWPVVRLLAVGPAARGLGVGRLLLDECLRRARADGSDAIGLHTSESMSGAMRLYDRMGFLRVPVYDFQPDGAELVKAYCLLLDD